MRKAKILMIEDEIGVMNFNREYLEELGYETFASSTLEQARFMLEEHAPDLILLDVIAA